MEIASDALAQMRWLRRHAPADARRVEDAMQERLEFEPTREDRNCKPTEEGAAGPWELRVQPYRVFNAVDEETRTVTVVALARKLRETATVLPKE